MKHNVVAPSVGESITEVSVLKWAKQSGQAVKTGELLLEIESDKATVEIVAEQSGVLQILKKEGERIAIGTPVGVIDDAGTATVAASPVASKTPPPPPSVEPVRAPSAPPPSSGISPSSVGSNGTPGPAARKLVTERGYDPAQIPGTGKDGRITKGDVISYTPGANLPGTSAASMPTPGLPNPGLPNPGLTTPSAPRPGERRVPMSMLRQRIAERLVQAQHTAAILTTFNEADMSAVMELRNKHKDAFKAKHGVALSFMSFFARASIGAIKAVPEVNASLEGRDVVYRDSCDLGIAVGTERGLVVPVVRGAEKISLPDLEKRIAELAIKARDGKLSIADLSGGTFTISNGGVYGSLLSTPILNPPQSGILGMHKIMDRPIAVDGKVVVRPMMYLALSYDHRLIDGKGAVTFLVTLKDLIEHPEKLGLEL